MEAVARHIILDTGELLPLAEVGTVQPEDRRIGLPSWVPDWTVSMKNKTSHKFSLMSPEYLHGHVSDLSKMFATPHVLVARGTYLGSIRTVLPRPKNLKINHSRPPEGATIRQSALSWAVQKESQPIVHAVCTVIREICANFNVHLWVEKNKKIAYQIDDIDTFRVYRPRDPEDTEETRNFGQLITNLYKTSQGANTSDSEDSEILLRPKIAKFLLRTLQNIYHIERRSKCIAISEEGGVARVNSRAREGDLLCHLKGSTGLYVVRPCGKDKDKDMDKRALISLLGRPERQTKVEKVRQGLGSVVGGRTGEEEGTTRIQMSLDVQLVDFVSAGDFCMAEWGRLKLCEDLRPGYDAVFAIH